MRSPVYRLENGKNAGDRHEMSREYRSARYRCDSGKPASSGTLRGWSRPHDGERHRSTKRSFVTSRRRQISTPTGAWRSRPTGATFPVSGARPRRRPLRKRQTHRTPRRHDHHGGRMKSLIHTGSAAVVERAPVLTGHMVTSCRRHVSMFTAGSWPCQPATMCTGAPDVRMRLTLVFRRPLPLRRPWHCSPRGRDEAWPRADRRPALCRQGGRWLTPHSVEGSS